MPGGPLAFFATKRVYLYRHEIATKRAMKSNSLFITLLLATCCGCTLSKRLQFDVEGLQKRCTPLDLVSIQEKIDAYRTKRGHKVEKAQVEDVSFDQESGTVLFPNAD